MLKNFFNLIVSVFATSTVISQVEPVKVLFIGNSYTHMNNMPALFELIAKSQGTDVYVEMSAESNHTFEMHTQRKTLFETIRSQKWDHIVLQGFSRELAQSQEEIDRKTTPYVKIILDSIYANNASTNVLLFMTWGYENGYLHREELNTYEKMTNKIHVGYTYLSEKFNVSIVPVGLVWKEFRTASTMRLYKKDGQHPIRKGSYLAACTFYASIFKKNTIGAKAKRICKKKASQIQSNAKYI